MILIIEVLIGLGVVVIIAALANYFLGD